MSLDNQELNTKTETDQGYIMITPAFELSQEEDFLVFSIRVPYTRMSEFDLYIDGEDFKFYAKPYFLRLTLPGRIVEDGREKASFDINKGLFTLRVPKETAGQHFEGLEMLTSLLAPRGSRSAKPLVEDMDACGRSEEGEEEDSDDFDWQVEQEVYTECSGQELNSFQKYGFGNKRSGVFIRLQEELGDVIDVSNPDATTAVERRQGRLAAETAKFDPDHYLADLFEDEAIENLLKFCPWWTKTQAEQSDTDTDGVVSSAAHFSEEEKEQLRQFTNRSYLLDKKCLHHIWLSLVDIILAYTYEIRTTEGEHNVESSWNIRKLSGTLCWLETYNSIQEVLVSFGRRVLCYPLYRNFSLVTAAVRDTALIFQSGKICVLKCLLDIHRIFRENDPAYILNDLYITDYCVWIQRVKSKKVTAIAEPLRKATLHKLDLGLELDELEAAAILAQEEEEEEEEEEEAGGGDLKLARSTSHSLSRARSSSSSSSEEEEESEDSGSEGTDTDKPPESASTHRLIEELGESVEAELSISEPLSNTDGGKTKPTGPQGTEAQPHTASTRTFLEVHLHRNPLLIVEASEDKEDD